MPRTQVSASRRPVRQLNIPGQSQITNIIIPTSSSRQARRTITRTVGAAPRKKPRGHDNGTPAPSAGHSPGTTLNDRGTSAQFQGASVHMRALLEAEESYLRGFNLRTWHSDVHPPTLCPHCPVDSPAPSTHRCLDCLGSPMLCRACIVCAHTFIPFHRVEVWTGTFFRRETLAELGLVINLEHGATACPQAPAGAKPVEITAVDTSGVQPARITYCHCLGRRSELEQLLVRRLWPATVASPQTVFTFDLLDDYHHHALTSRKAALDYWNALCRKSSNAFPESVPDRYALLLRTSRFYRYIRALERSGQPFDIDRHLSTLRRPGMIAVPCYACPEPGFNIDPNWADTPPDLAYIHRLFASMDANFANQNKIKTKSDPDDISLFNGRCYFPAEADFQTYLSNVTHTDEKSECSNHKAVNLQNVLKFKHMSVTGIIAVVCKHDCFRPGSHNDLQRGERFANGDYAMHGAMTWLPVPHQIAWSYDIICQYMANVSHRWQKCFPESHSLLEHVIPAIPKKHLPGHKDNCKIRYSCNFLQGFGRFYGEGIEAVWAEDNQQRGSLREMNNGHRHDVTDDNHIDWNFRKNQKMAHSTKEHYLLALSEYNNAVIEFQAADQAAPPGQVSAWLRTDNQPREISKGVWTSVYQTQRAKAPTQAQIYARLTRTEITSDIRNLKLDVPSMATPGESAASGAAQFIWAGLQIQRAQSELSRRAANATSAPDTREQEALDTARLKLQLDIHRWRRHQTNRLPAFPAALERLPAIDGQFPEHELLGLPSDFPDPQVRVDLGLDSYAPIELQLRQGQANDCLENLREDIRYEYCLKGQKTVHARGTGATTRAQNLLQAAAAKKNATADFYIAARLAMLALGSRQTDPTFLSQYPPLDKSRDMWMRDPMEIITLGDGTRHEPWIWRVGLAPHAEGASAWQLETDRVRWFKSRAAMHRWREEINIRLADFDRIERAYTRMAQAWANISLESSRTLGSTPDESVPRALMAYASKTSHYNSTRAAECKSLHMEATQSELARETNIKMPT